MSVHIVVSCNGTWDNGRMPCRAWFPTTTNVPAQATGQAAAGGWSTTGDKDLCAAHTLDAARKATS